MNIYKRVRAINGAAAKNSKKEVMTATIQRDMLSHFRDSIDYENNVIINGESREMIVSRNKSVTTEKKIVAKPGETIPLGGLVECYGCKWLVVDVDPNQETYVSGKIEQCNREICWQNTKTGEIHRRWCTLDKPYFSNLDKNKRTVISTREYKLYLQYDAETSLLDVDKRFMLEIIGGEPKTYRITSVDTMTQRLYINGEIQGLVCLYIEQDQYKEGIDNVELMICDYQTPESSNDDSSDYYDYVTANITYRNNSELKIGGSYKTFSPSFTNSDGEVIEGITPVWRVNCLDEFMPYIETTQENGRLKVKVKNNRVMEGGVVRVELSDSENRYSSFVECKVVTLI